MLGSARWLGTGLLLMVAGAASDRHYAWVVIAAGLALVTAAVLNSLEMELRTRMALSDPAAAHYAYGAVPSPTGTHPDMRATPPPPPRGRREVITRERRERHW